MIPKECKRLIEVDFPIGTVSRNSVIEKSGPKGHISTLHLWWARRPLGACRSVLMALLLPDPCDSLCPKEFKDAARRLLPSLTGKIDETDEALRSKLLKYIADFSLWENAGRRDYLEVASELIRHSYPDQPFVVDPFAGGGSIPMEAIRTGCDVFASDLNPVACLINKVVIEDIPRNREKMVSALERVGQQIFEEARRILREVYPIGANNARPIGYIWARTIVCESPNCGCEIPLVRSFWLSQKGEKKVALKYRIEKHGARPEIAFDIFTPRSDTEVPTRTVSRAKAQCPNCRQLVLPERVREQILQQSGGVDPILDKNGDRIGGARLLAVISSRVGLRKEYRLPAKTDYQALMIARDLLNKVAPSGTPTALSLIPNEPTPVGGGSGAGRAFSVAKYGMKQFCDLFSTRQKLSLSVLMSLIQAKSNDNQNSEVLDILSLVFDRVAMCGMSLTNWNAHSEKMQHTFGRQALPIVWDFCEVVPIEPFPGSWKNALDLALDVITGWPSRSNGGQVQVSDAAHSPLPDGTASIWFTDPPYYDAVPYADLSDFFFVWLKRIRPNHNLLKDPFDKNNTLTPKDDEAVQDETKTNNGHPKDRAFFERKMESVFREGHRVLSEDGIGCVVFAHKTTEGWEALLSALVNAGWVITASWPIATEMASRLRARESAALATSIHLICRPRSYEAGIGDWANILRELPNRISDWMDRLDREGIHGADLVFSCIGPALELFSRFERVETAEGKTVTLAEHLEKVWEVVGRTALEQILGTAEARARNGAAGVLEEDSRLTALFLWTLMSSATDANMNGDDGRDDENDDDDEEEDGKGKKKSGYSLQFDVARRFAQPLGIDLERWKGRIIEIEKGVVRLISVKDRSEQLFGTKGASEIAHKLERFADKAQMILFPVEQAALRRSKSKGRSKRQEDCRKLKKIRGKRRRSTASTLQCSSRQVVNQQPLKP